MLHLHDFDHVQVRLCRRLVDSKNSINNVRGKLLSEGVIKLR
jgi:hypothetical protein